MGTTACNEYAWQSLSWAASTSKPPLGVASVFHLEVPARWTPSRWQLGSTSYAGSVHVLPFQPRRLAARGGGGTSCHPCLSSTYRILTDSDQSGEPDLVNKVSNLISCFMDDNTSVFLAPLSAGNSSRGKSWWTMGQQISASFLKPCLGGVPDHPGGRERGQQAHQEPVRQAALVAPHLQPKLQQE